MGGTSRFNVEMFDSPGGRRTRISRYNFSDFTIHAHAAHAAHARAQREKSSRHTFFVAACAACAAWASMQFVIPGCKEEPPLRATGLMVHLTYAALYDGELTFDSVLAAARGWGAAHHGLREYMIGRETHPSPADPQRPKHFHAYFKFGKRIDVRDRLHTTYFDLQGQNGRVLHPELQSVLPTPGDRERVINYDMKDGEYVSELEMPLVNDPRRDKAEAEARDAASDAEEPEEQEMEKDKVPGWARMLSKANSTTEGMALLAEKAPHIYFLNGSRIKPMLTERVGTPEPKLFTLADFNRPALTLEKPVVLHGATECCKTEFALAHFDSPLVVRRRRLIPVHSPRCNECTGPDGHAQLPADREKRYPQDQINRRVTK